MPNEVLANEVLAALPEAALSEPDYRAFCAALEASARGRAFLSEFARRNRHANTEILLTALDRLEAVVHSQAATAEADRIRQELRALLAALRAAQPVIDASAAAIKAAKLAAMIGFVQHRIESIVTNERSPLPVEVAALILPDEAEAEPTRSHLVVVPRAEQPELPIPSPAAVKTPTIALVESVQPELPPESPKPGSIQIAAQAPQPVPAEPQLVQDPPPVGQTPEPVPSAEETPQPIVEPITPLRMTAATMPEVNLFDRAPVTLAVTVPVVDEAADATAQEIAEATAIETGMIAGAICEFDDALCEKEAATVAPAYGPLIATPAGLQDDYRAPEDFDTAVPLPAAADASADSSIGPSEQLCEDGSHGQAANPEPMETAGMAEIVGALPTPIAQPETVEMLPADDPLALIMALSEAERIALFT